MKRAMSTFPKYRQVLDNGNIRIVTIVVYKYKVTAACKEFREGYEDADDARFYHMTFRKTLAKETIAQLKQKAMGYYNVKEEERIN